ncbi:placenta-specific gene 8 protein-like [Mytilus edulis]|uniref:placenta-specific gene 8 protein-like n=1 Tax=Mytilus edulis TaxID=6550 RepID=UPI0039EE9DA0
MAAIVTVQPQSQMGNLLLSNVHGHRDWSTGLCDCFSDCKTCIIGYCCLPCLTCSVASRIGECCCMHYFVPGGTINMRTRIRTLGGIQGSACNDCLVVNFCCICAICQMSREIDNMGIP